tara:strand:+ start:66 stop:284 length:219 start_codon:yes stop_codon:yes gene_type:complete
MKHHTYEDGLKYKPNYKWPKPGTVKNCPKCKRPLELCEDSPSYYGKPWWCYKCQWQFSEEDLEELKSSKKSK